MQTIQQRPDSSHEQTPFRSVLFDGADTGAGVDEEAPPFFADLNLDQVITSITAGREEYHLEPFFYAPLHSVGAVDYRHEVLRDLEDERLYGHIASFAEEMRTMRIISRKSRSSATGTRRKPGSLTPWMCTAMRSSVWLTT